MAFVSALAFCRDRRFVHGWRGRGWRLSADIKVSGSDTGFYPPMGEQARNIKATLFEDYDSDVKSRPADCYIIGNALSAR